MANDNVDRMAVDVDLVSQITVPPFPELSHDAFRNPLAILRYNKATQEWRKALARRLARLPLKQENE